MDAKFIELNRGAPFNYTNTGNAEQVVTIETAAGSKIEVRLAPGGEITAVPTENLRFTYGSGRPPGIECQSDPQTPTESNG